MYMYTYIVHVHVQYMCMYNVCTVHVQYMCCTCTIRVCMYVLYIFNVWRNKICLITGITDGNRRINDTPIKEI